MHKVYLSLGSNMGDKIAYLDQAITLLQGNDNIHNLKRSALYQTDPVGYEDQDVFVNMAAYLETTLSPLELLDVCQSIELALDRVRLIRWGPRTIDIDIILFDQLELTSERLILPHPRATERGFVLIPIQALNPAVKVNGRLIDEWIEKLPPSGVRKL